MENNEQQILTDSIRNLEINNFNNGLIQDNKLIFINGEKTYRVRMPIQSEQALVDNKRNIAQLEYLRQEGCITKKQLIQQLKSSGIFNINEAEEKREQLTREIKHKWILLAATSSDNKNNIEELTSKIHSIEDELKQIAIDTAMQLSPSLESRLEKFTIEYLAFLCTDTQDKNKWNRTWNTFEDFQKEDSSLVERAAANMTWLMLNKRS
jgi:hypothetical protein